jgi:hypothetical protein
MKETTYGWHEIAGITFYMIRDKISPLLHSKKAAIAVFVFVALGISILIGGAVTYLSTYGQEDSSTAATLHQETSISQPTPTPSPTPAPAQALILPVAPSGQWTDEACKAAGSEINAAMASFFTGPQGSGCNVLVNGSWIALP